LSCLVPSPHHLSRSRPPIPSSLCRRLFTSCTNITIPHTLFCYLIHARPFISAFMTKFTFLIYSSYTKTAVCMAIVHSLCTMILFLSIASFMNIRTCSQLRLTRPTIHRQQPYLPLNVVLQVWLDVNIKFIKMSCENLILPFLDSCRLLLHVLLEMSLALVQFPFVQNWQ
jgi:hypothetical protein